MKFKRGISLALALALIAGIGGPLDIRAAAADTGSSDAIAALGIDSSKAPDGFNANDPSNPYGRNTSCATRMRSPWSPPRAARSPQAMHC